MKILSIDRIRSFENYVDNLKIRFEGTIVDNAGIARELLVDLQPFRDYADAGASVDGVFILYDEQDLPKSVDPIELFSELKAYCMEYVPDDSEDVEEALLCRASVPMIDMKIKELEAELIEESVEEFETEQEELIKELSREAIEVFEDEDEDDDDDPASCTQGILVWE